MELKAKIVEIKILGQIIQIRNCYSLKFKNVQLEIIKLQRNVLHLNCSLKLGNLKLRIPLTFGIKSENCGNKIWAKLSKFEIAIV